MANTKISALPTFTGNTTGVYVVIDNSGLTETYKISIDSLLSALSGITTTNDVRARYLISTYASGDEGGEINLAKAPNGTLSGDTVIDNYVNRVRIFEGGGNSRGVYVDLSKAPNGVGGELLWKTSGLVNAGTFITLDNLKATIPTSGNRGLSIASVSGTFTANISATYASAGGSSGSAFNSGIVNTTPSTSLFGWNFVAEGDGATYMIFDKTNNRMYRVSMMIGVSYLNNFISIERLY